MRLYLSADTKEKIGYTPDWIRVSYTEGGTDYELTLDIFSEIDYMPDTLDCRCKGDLEPFSLVNRTTGEDVNLEAIENIEEVFSIKKLADIFRYGRDIAVSLDIIKDEEWYELARKDEFSNCRGTLCLFDGEEEHEINFTFTPELGGEELQVKENMKYYVTFKMEARYVAEVEATSLAEARKAAESQFFDADFGDAFDIDGEPIVVEDENGDYLWGYGNDWKEPER